MYSDLLRLQVHLQDALFDRREQVLSPVLPIDYIYIVGPGWEHVLQDTELLPLVGHDLKADQVHDKILIRSQLHGLVAEDQQVFPPVFFHFIYIVKLLEL